MITKVALLGLLFSPLAGGSGEWQEQIKCVAELVRTDVVLTDRTEVANPQALPLRDNASDGVFRFAGGAQIRFAARFLPGASKWSHKGDTLALKAWLFQGERLLATGQSDSDTVSNFYGLRLAQKQQSKIQVILRLLNVAVERELLRHDKPLKSLIGQGILSPQAPWIGHLICSLSRPVSP